MHAYDRKRLEGAVLDVLYRFGEGVYFVEDGAYYAEEPEAVAEEILRLLDPGR